MIDLDEVRAEIDRLKKEETSYRNCEKIAVLASVLSFFDSKSQEAVGVGKYSSRSEALNFEGSEFIVSARQAEYDKLLSVMDEHMESIKLVYPKEYALIIRKLSE